MFGDKTTAKQRLAKGAKGDAMRKALHSKIDKKYVKQGIKEAHKRAKREGYDFNKV